MVGLTDVTVDVRVMVFIKICFGVTGPRKGPGPSMGR